MRGYTLNIGVEKTEREHYDRVIRARGAKRDAIDLYNLIAGTGIYDLENSAYYCNEEATTTNFFAHIKKLKTITTAVQHESHYIFISFSGHGAQHEYNGNTYQFLCFHDQLMLEHEFMEAIYSFNSNVKLFILLDACYSHGMTALKRFEQFGFSDLAIKTLTEDETLSIFDPSRRGKEYEEKIRSAKYPSTRKSTNSCFLSACSKEDVTYQASLEGGRSLFTDAFIAAFQNGSFNGNYIALYAAIIRLISTFNGPQISGATKAYFHNHKPLLFNDIAFDWRVEAEIIDHQIHCHVYHPKFWFKAGSIKVGAIGWSELENWNHPDYEEGDLILKLSLNHNEKLIPTQKTSFTLNYKPDQNGTKAFVVPINNLKGEYKAMGIGIKIPVRISMLKNLR